MPPLWSDTIWVPVDFRGASRKQVHMGAAIAARTGATLRLVHALDLPDLHAHRANLEAIREQVRQKAADVMAQLAEEARRLGAGAQADVLADTRLADLIRTMAGKPEALVIVGQGHHDKERTPLGAATLKLIRKLPNPVLVVDENHPLPSPIALRKILFPHDFSRFGEEGMRLAAEVAKTFGASLELLHVIRTPIYLPVFPGEAPIPLHIEDVDTLKTESARNLKALATQLSPHGLSVSTALTLAGDIGRAVADHARQGGFDLVIAPSHGYGSIDRWVMKIILLGSEAENIVRNCPVPVLIHRPPSETA